MIGLIRAHVISGQQSRKRRLLLAAFVAKGVNVIDVAAGGRLRFLSRADDHGFLRFALHSVRVGKNELAFVIGAGFEIQKAAREHIGRHIAVVMLAAFAWRSAEHLLMLQPQKREALAPQLFTFLAISNIDACIAVVVAGDFPCEAERDQSRRIDYELAGSGFALAPADRRNQKCSGKREEP